MSDDYSFTIYPITLTHSGARVEEDRRIAHHEVVNFINASNESRGVGIRFALTEKEAQAFALEYDKKNHSLLGALRFFTVEFIHSTTVYKTTISSANTTVRAKTRVNYDDDAICSIHAAASKQIAGEIVGKESPDIDYMSYSITEGADEITINEVLN